MSESPAETQAAPAPDPFYSVQAIAAAWDRDEDWVRGLIHSGELVANQFGRTLRVTVASYDAYIARTRLRPARPGLSAVPA